MKAVILAGGLGTRLSEESHLKPKPMIEIGGKPILWRYALAITERIGLNSNSFVIEIASNDGCFLKNFVAAGIPCLRHRADSEHRGGSRRDRCADDSRILRQSSGPDLGRARPGR